MTVLSSVVVWLRDDLRLADNPALIAAAQTGAPVLAIYIHDTVSDGLRPPGGAAKWWLHHALQSLARAIEAIGGRLDLFEGPSSEIIDRLVSASGASTVFWNRRYGGAEIAIDTAIKSALKARGIDTQSFNGHLLYEPWSVQSKDATAFKVFTPFWRAARASGDPAAPRQAPNKLHAPPYPDQAPPRRPLDALDFLPKKPDWAGGLRAAWMPDESGAHAALQAFVKGHLRGYGQNRDRPDLPGTSRLSPYLRHGLLSPWQVFHAVEAAAQEQAIPRSDIDKFQAELGWREFSYHLLFQMPELATRNFQPRFDAFPWTESVPDALAAWQQGRTGYPIVDAGMRQLWQTGYMHNRVRMITGSFLIKDLMIDWRRGEEWFWDTLCDADPASNSASWQWVAGSGADAAPYFRVFNPSLQGAKFDPNGAYIRTFVPELDRLDAEWIHQPWQAPAPELTKAGVTLGKSYPHPIVDHAKARDRALEAFAALKAKTP